MVQRLRKSLSHFQNTTLLAGWAQLSAGIDRARLESSATEQLKEWVALARGEAGIRNLREAVERWARLTMPVEAVARLRERKLKKAARDADCKKKLADAAYQRQLAIVVAEEQRDEDELAAIDDELAVTVKLNQLWW